jgi:hypothetical protein
MKKSILTVLISLLTVVATAQNYNKAIGVRGGYFNGLTYKQFFNEKFALEGLFTFRYYGMHLTGLLEFHNDISEVEGLRWYLGGGAHVGTYRYFYYDKHNVYGYRSALYTGFDGILGIEYTFDFIPINLSLDWKPTFNFSAYDYAFFGYDSGAFSIRYTFE